MIEYSYNNQIAGLIVVVITTGRHYQVYMQALLTLFETPKWMTGRRFNHHLAYLNERHLFCRLRTGPTCVGRSIVSHKRHVDYILFTPDTRFVLLQRRLWTVP